MSDHKYLESIKEIENLFKFAMKISVDTHGRQVEERKEEVASQIFTKICLHLSSILRISPHSSFSKTTKDFEVWDYTSIAVLTRSIMDAYYVFFYLCIDEIEKEDRNFRFLVWDYHSENRRLKQLQLIGSEHKDIPEIEKNVNDLREKVKNNPKLKGLDRNLRKGIVRGEIPFILTNLQIANFAGINDHYHKSSYMYLSSYIHTFPFSISQTSAIDNLSQILQLAKPILDSCFGYLCLTIRDYIKLFPDQKVYLVGEFQEKIETWENIFKELFN